MNPAVVPDLLSNAAARFPERTAVLIAGQAPVSYRDLAARVEGFASRLWARGVRPGDRIAVRASNSLVYFDAFLSAARLGRPPYLSGPVCRRPRWDMYYGTPAPPWDSPTKRGPGRWPRAAWMYWCRAVPNTRTPWRPNRRCCPIPIRRA